MLYPRKTLAPALSVSKIRTLSLIVTVLHSVVLLGAASGPVSRAGQSPSRSSWTCAFSLPPWTLPLPEPHSHAPPLLQRGELWLVRGRPSLAGEKPDIGVSQSRKSSPRMEASSLSLWARSFSLPASQEAFSFFQKEV